MRNNIIQMFAVSIGFLICQPVLNAQLVVVRPGYVKAPFVRVIRYADGSTYVRAPFVSVGSVPRYGPTYYAAGTHAAGTYVAGTTAAPSLRDIAVLDAPLLRGLVKHFAGQLDAQLAQFPTGDVWRTHFRLDEIRSVTESPDAPTAEELATFTEWVGNYDKALENDDLRAVTQLEEFKILHAGLLELLKPREVRLRQQWACRAAELHGALGEIQNGGGWQAYLIGEVPSPRVAPDAPVESMAQRLDDNQLAERLVRFEKVEREPKYRVIAQMPEFAIAHGSLRALVAQTSTRAGESADDLEILPVPPVRDTEDR